MTKMLRFSTLLMITLFGAGAFAQVQTLTPVPAAQTAAPTQAVAISVNYTTVPPTATTGIGVRVHYNPTRVTFAGFTNTAAAGIVTFDPAGTCNADVGDQDGDPLTTCTAIAAFVEVGGNFAATQTPLFVANFITTAGFNALTTIRFTRSSGQGTFASTPATISPAAVLTVLSVTCPAGLTAGGAAGTSTVTLSAAAPIGGTTVALTSSAPGTATVPATVLVPAGATSATFPVTPGATAGNSTITATLGASSTTCVVAVGAALAAPTAASVSCPIGLTAGGPGGSAIVTLSGPAPVGGTLVTVSSGTPGVATAPASFTIPQGATTGNVTITPVSAGTSVISVTAGGVTQTCTVTVGASAAPIPTLDDFGIIAMMILLGGAAILVMSRKA